MCLRNANPANVKSIVVEGTTLWTWVMSVLESPERIPAQLAATPLTESDFPADAKSKSSQLTPFESPAQFQSDVVTENSGPGHNSAEDGLITMSTSSSLLSSSTLLTTRDVQRLPYKCRDFSIARLLESEHPSSASRACSLPLDLRPSNSGGKKLEEHAEGDLAGCSLWFVNQHVWLEGHLNAAERDAELCHQSSSQLPCHHQLLKLQRRADDDERMRLCTPTIGSQRRMTDGESQRHSITCRHEEEGLYLARSFLSVVVLSRVCVSAHIMRSLYQF